ncbi:hypothetical protein LINPERPRIM_LOCUS21626, partial [Linum perenne]
GVVDPNTNRTQLNNELRTAMQGVGVYTIPTTGNMYYRVPPGGLDARVVDDVHVFMESKSNLIRFWLFRVQLVSGREETRSCESEELNGITDGEDEGVVGVGLESESELDWSQSLIGVGLESDSSRSQSRGAEMRRRRGGGERRTILQLA